MKKQRGFTLIELMIVVAIVAILAAVALPFYADFTVRARVSEVAAAMDSCKLEVADVVEATRDWPAATAVCQVLATGGGTQYVDAVSFALNGTDGEVTGIAAVETKADGAPCNMTLTANATGTAGTDLRITGWSGWTTCTNYSQLPPGFRAAAATGTAM